MGKILVAAAALLGLYAFYDGGRIGRHGGMSTPGALVAPTGTPSKGIGASAVGLAGRVGN